MATEYPLELIGTDRPNRFQVNPVTSSKNATADDVEPFDEDTFNDEEIVLRNNRRSSRYVFWLTYSCISHYTRIMDSILKSPMNFGSSSKFVDFCFHRSD